MNSSIIAWPSGVLTAGIAAAQVVPTEIGPAVGSLSAAVAVIVTVSLFIKRQEKTAEEFAKMLSLVVDSNDKSNTRFANELSSVAQELGGVRESVGAIVERNTVKDLKDSQS